jgi:hypothetical protein
VHKDGDVMIAGVFPIDNATMEGRNTEPTAKENKVQ